MSWRLLKGFLVLGCVLIPGIAAAQSAIAGVARDSSGAVLPGVTVEVSSPALIEKTRSASPTTRVNTAWSICGPERIR